MRRLRHRDGENEELNEIFRNRDYERLSNYLDTHNKICQRQLVLGIMICFYVGENEIVLFSNDFMISPHFVPCISKIFDNITNETPGYYRNYVLPSIIKTMQMREPVIQIPHKTFGFVIWNCLKVSRAHQKAAERIYNNQHISGFANAQRQFTPEFEAILQDIENKILTHRESEIQF